MNFSLKVQAVLYNDKRDETMNIALGLLFI